MPRISPISSGKRTTSSSSSPTSTAPARPAPTSCSRARCCAWACRWRRATSSRPTSRACRPGTRCASRGRPPRRARRRRPDGGDEPADLGQGRRRDRARRLPVLRPTKPLPKSKFRDDITVIGVPLTAICNREYTDPRQRQLFKNIIYVGALSALLDMDLEVIEKLLGEQFKGKEKLIEPNIQALHLGRDYALMNLDCPLGLRLRAPTRSATASSSRATAPRAGRGLRRRHGVRLVSDHAVVLARRGLRRHCRGCASIPDDQAQQVRHRAGRGRARLDRHGDRRGLERRARLHRHLGARHLADAGIHRARLLSPRSRR